MLSARSRGWGNKLVRAGGDVALLRAAATVARTAAGMARAGLALVRGFGMGLATTALFFAGEGDGRSSQ